jgi:PAS domain S-box-containing protein
VRYISINRDVTERKRREREYEQIFNGVNDSITIHDPETGELLDVNDAFCNLVGHDREEIIESGVMEYVPGGRDYTAEDAKEFIREVVETGEPKRTEWAVETADGEIRQLEVTGTTVEIGGELRYVAIDRDVTERKRREQEFEQIFNGVKDPIAVFDPDTGEITDVNEPYHDMIGYDEFETIRELGIGGLSAGEGYTEERGAELIREVSNTGDPTTVEWEAETANGDRRYLEITLSPAVIQGEDRVLTIQRDVTERKRREQEYEQIFNSVQDAIAVHDSETGEMIEVNDTFCELVGYDRETVLELGTGGVSVDEEGYTVERSEAIIETVMNEGQMDPIEWKVETSEGEHRVIEVVATTAEIGGETRFLSINRDITERKRREREYEQIFNSVQDTIAVIDPDTYEMVDVNDAFCELVGYDRETILELGIQGVSVDREDYTMERSGEIIEEVMNEGETKPFEWEVETSQGERRVIEVVATTAEIGGEMRFLSINRDVTERKRREQRLEVFNRILRHNLRNQLDVIQSHAELLADRTGDDHAERIVAAVRELAGIGRRARQVDRILSKEDTLTEINITRTLRETVKTMEPTGGDVAVTTKFPEEARLRTDEETVTMAVESALENALEHATEAVIVTVEDGADECIITVADDGPGIPEEELMPIEAETETRHQHGRGLGLWQLRWCVDNLNGELSFETGAGTTVRITVPDRRESGPPE